MSFCTFADGAAMFDATPIENLFLMEHMYDAPEAALKVYLFARMLALHPELGGTLADMAGALRMDEEDVRAAFDYWERRDLVCRTSDQPTYAFKALRVQETATALDREMYANREFNNELRKLFNQKFIDYRELRKASDWLNILKYEPAAALRLVEYGVQTSRSKDPKPASVFKRMDKLAEAWSQKGIHTLQEVERAIAEETGEALVARNVLNKLGMTRQPTDPELSALRKWTRDWGFTEEAILAACDDTISARNPTFRYLESILDTRRGENPDHYRALSEVLKELNPQAAQPTPDQLTRYGALLDQGFAPELIRLAAIQCHRANKLRFEDLEWRLSVWRKDGVATPAEAEDYMRRMTALSRQLREVFRRAGSDKRPGYGELETYRAWKDRYPDELIDFAAECSRHAGDVMPYMDKLLERWAQAGATTAEAARAQHAAWRAASGAPEGGKPANPALDYAQREYRDEDFGEDFFVDLSQYGEEERK